MTPVTNGLSAKRASIRASGTTTWSGSTRLTAHMESSRAQTPGSKPTAAIWCWRSAEMTFTTAFGTPQMYAASSTTAGRSGRGGASTTRKSSSERSRSISSAGTGYVR